GPRRQPAPVLGSALPRARRRVPARALREHGAGRDAPAGLGGAAARRRRLTERARSGTLHPHAQVRPSPLVVAPPSSGVAGPRPNRILIGDDRAPRRAESRLRGGSRAFGLPMRRLARGL